MSASFRESNARAILKAFSWRFLATVATICLVYLFTGELALAAAVGGIEVFLKLALYFLHERMWNVIPFGRSVIQESAETQPEKKRTPRIPMLVTKVKTATPTKIIETAHLTRSSYTLEIEKEL